MKKLLDGKKNCVLVLSGDHINGTFHEEILGVDLEDKPKKLRIEAILYSLENSAVIKFDDVFIPLSGRGKLDFEQFHAMPVENPKITIEGKGAYFFMFDLEKH